jgi:hypothetical protein
MVSWLAFAFYMTVVHFCVTVENVFKLTSVIVTCYSTCLKAETNIRDDIAVFIVTAG